MSSAIEIAAGCKLPAAVAERCTQNETVAPSKVLRTQHMKTEANYAVAPYQAMPVAGPVITHNKAAAQDVLAPGDELPQEVRSAARRRPPSRPACSTTDDAVRVRAGAGEQRERDHREVHQEAGRAHQPPHGVRAPPRAGGVAGGLALVPPRTPPRRLDPIAAGRAQLLAIDHRPLASRYPYNLDFDYGALEGLTKYSINNLGDPFIESNYGVHSREFEVCAMDAPVRVWCGRCVAAGRTASPGEG
jgi:hypothetical protein